MYHQTPQIDLNNTFVNFNPSLYSKSAIARIYVPYCANLAATCSGSNRVARDPGTGATVGSGFIGDYVPNSGNPATGLQTLGVNGVSSNPYTQAALAYGPRLGFAYDVMGDGKTAIRGGWGMFYNRLDGNQVYGMSGQAPSTFQQTVNDVTLDQIAGQNTGAAPSFTNLSVSPLAPNSWTHGKVPFDAVQNASIDIQRNIGRALVVDLGYTLNYSYNQKLTYNVNSIPIGAGPDNGRQHQQLYLAVAGRYSSKNPVPGIQRDQLRLLPGTQQLQRPHFQCESSPAAWSRVGRGIHLLAGYGRYDLYSRRGRQ
jgi:hypothetical protein